jgi:hypothetical protein
MLRVSPEESLLKKRTLFINNVEAPTSLREEPLIR